MMTLLFALSLTTAEARKPQAPPAPPPPPIPLVPPDEEGPATAGSRFSDVEARRLMGMDGSARRVGDLVTVQVFEESKTMLAAQTSTSRSNNHTTELRTLLGIEKRILKAHQDLQSVGIDFGSESSFEGAGDTSRDSEVEAVITCQVIDVLPGGNLRLWGWKQVRVNRETQYVVLDGLARPRDIQLNNTIDSDLLAQAKIEFTGSGVIADRQGPGWLTRILDAIWPF